MIIPNPAFVPHQLDLRLKRTEDALELPPTPWRLLLLLLAADLLLKAIIVYLDSTPRLFIGDSLSYLYTAISGWIPPDRSFVYGFLVRLCAVWPHSLQSLLWCQAALSGVSAWLVAVCLVRYFQTPLPVAGICSFLCALEPLQLLAERYVLTEVDATFVFALFVLSCFSYLSSRRLVALAFVQFSGVVLVSLRISFLPIVIVCSFALPFLDRRLFHRLRNVARYHPPENKRLLQLLLTPVVFGVLFSQLLLLGYRHLYGDLIAPPLHGHPAYFYTEGLFLVSDFAPLLKPVDYPIPSQRADIFSPSRVPLAPPENRDAQRWYPDGLCDRIIRECHGDERAADRLAHRTALRALKRDPLGAIRLGVRTASLYFDRPYFLETLRVDEGYYRSVPPAEAAQYRQRFGFDYAANTARLSKAPPFTERWHRGLYLWYWFLLLLPFAFFAWLILFKRYTTPAHWLCAVFLLVLFEGAVLTVTRPTARFLTTMAWLAFIALGASYSTLAAYRKGTRSSPKEEFSGRFSM